MDLNITEKFLLIALQPEKRGFVLPYQEIDYGLTGAILIDMLLEDRIEIDDKKLKLKNGKNGRDPVISEAINMISNAGKEHKIYYWINRLDSKAHIFKREITENLEKKGLIRIEHRKFLGIISYKRYIFIDIRLRESLINQLRESILFHKDLNKENIAMAGLIDACRIHNVITNEKSEIKTLRKEISIILKENPFGNSVEKIVRQVQQAISGTSAEQSMILNNINQINNTNQVNNI